MASVPVGVEEVEESSPTPTGSRPVGRPPRISRDAVAAAAREIGLADLSLRRVADHLGVSVATLYHHIDGKDDLLRLAADQEARDIVIPVAANQSWPLWLAEWGRYTFESFADRPALFDQFLRGGISAEVIAENTERVLEHLVGLGFAVDEAADAYELVSACATGAAVTALRSHLTDASSESLGDVLANRAPDELPLLRTLSTERGGMPFNPVDRFADALRTTIVGIGAHRGESETDVLAALDG